jgi:hypothetical protein
MAWQVWAAVIGAVLGITNLVRSLSASRPTFQLSPRVVGGEAQIRLEVVNLARQPLLMRNIRIYPDGIYPYDEDENGFDRTGFRRTWLHMTERRFVKIIPAEEKQSIHLYGLERGGWCVVVLRWSQGNTLLPWSIVIGRRALIRDLFDSVCPQVD